MKDVSGVGWRGRRGEGGRGGGVGRGLKIVVKLSRRCERMGAIDTSAET